MEGERRDATGAVHRAGAVRRLQRIARHRRAVAHRGGAMALAGACVASMVMWGSGGAVAGASGGGTLTIGMVQAFTGTTAIDGIAEAAGCYPAERVINEAGGVLGHKIQCVPVDTRGDPSDAIPAAQKLLATTPGLVGVEGPESGTATSIVPLFTNAHIPMITQNGLALYNKNKDPYFWRNYPPDDEGGVALAYWAHRMGFKRGALFFDNSVAAQSSVPGLTKTFEHLGGKVVINVSATPDSASYGSEMHKVLQAKPQVIFTESDPQTDAVAFRNLVELGKPIPIFGTNATVIPSWLKAVTKSLGKTAMAKYYRGVEPYAPNFPGTKYFNQALLASAKQVTTPKQWLGQEYATTPFDGTIIFALAMTEANSTKGAVFDKDIMNVTAPGKGKKVVYSYSAGVKALKAGKKIQYVGASGPTIFNKYHNAEGEFGVYQYTNHKLKVIHVITASQLAQAQG